MLCEREPAGTLVDRCNGFFCFTLPHTFPTGKRYVLVPDKVSADDARIGCEQQNGKLVVFESREEREQLWHELQDLVPAPQIWVGLSSMTLGADASVDASLATTTWAWEDTKPADGPGAAYPEPWGVGEPTLAARRAYSLFFPSRVDNQLAHASDVVATASYVCQL